MSDERTRSGDLEPAPDRSTPAPPERIGVYHLLRRIGEGGMGEVWETEQERPVRRVVALKLIKWGMDTKQVILRFESERQALALMDHPSIARVFDAGATEQGRPYFAMEYVDGVPIDVYCERGQLATPARLALFIAVCDGVQHAHQKGIVHRDIKPSNILVRDEDGRGAPKIIDFGVAKAVTAPLDEGTLLTAMGQIVGTPEYMSPEQLDIRALDVDTRSDVYALGVLLYRLLTGTVPFALKQRNFEEFRRAIREDEPERPSARAAAAAPGDAARRAAVARQLRGDLDWITLRALEKDRARRYASASELAADLRRHLQHQPVVASPPSASYRTAKFVRRHRTGVVATSLVALALIAGTVAATIGLVRARAAEAEAQLQAQKAAHEAEVAGQISRFLEGLLLSGDPNEGRGQRVTVREVLDLGAAQIHSKLGDQPLLQAQLMETIGRVYTNLGLYAQAQPLLDRALALREQWLSPDDPAVAASLRSLAGLFFAMQDYHGARQLSERALAILEHAYGPDDPEVAMALTNLAHVLRRTGDPTQARQRYERALEIQLATLGPDHPEVGLSLQGLADVLREQGQDEEVRRLYERVLAIQEKALRPDHPHVARTLDSLAALHQRRGDRATALQLYQRALRIKEQALPPDHPDLADSLNGLATLHVAEKRYVLAQQLLERALSIREGALRPNHRRVGETLWQIASLRRLQGDRAGADALYRRALAVMREAKGENDPWFLYDEACYAALHGQREAALDKLARAIALGFPRDYPATDDDMASLHADAQFLRIVASSPGGA